MGIWLLLTGFATSWLPEAFKTSGFCNKLRRPLGTLTVVDRNLWLPGWVDLGQTTCENLAISREIDHCWCDSCLWSEVGLVVLEGRCECECYKARVMSVVSRFQNGLSSRRPLHHPVHWTSLKKCGRGAHLLSIPHCYAQWS